MEIPDIYLTLHGNLSLAPKMWLRFVCCHITSICLESGRLSQSSKCCLCIQCGVSEDRGGTGDSLSHPDTVLALKATDPSSVSAMTLKTQIKDRVQPPAAAIAFCGQLSFRMPGKDRNGGERRNLDGQSSHPF